MVILLVICQRLSSLMEVKDFVMPYSGLNYFLEKNPHPPMKVKCRSLNPKASARNYDDTGNTDSSFTKTYCGM